MRALVSVYDKSGLIPFVKRLVAAGYGIVSSGGTARELETAGIPVVTVEEVTGSSEFLGGRVKTLHPKIHGGILAREGEDDAELAERGIEPFDLIVCNLYPFRETLADPSADEAELIEKIDIGGPAMIRAAAKNHHRVGVVVSPDQYDEVAAAVERGELDLDLRRRLAAEAFFHTAGYDAAITAWLGEDRLVPLRLVAPLRYGENPHQSAWLYQEEGKSSWWLGAATIQGKEMSFNNYLDADAAWRLAHRLGPGSVVVVKHTNPCGAAVAGSVAESFRLAWEGDPLSAFGGVIAVNGAVGDDVAATVVERFVEVIVAREVTEAAMGLLAGKPNMRVLVAGPPVGEGLDYRRIDGGFLAQTPDAVEAGEWETVSRRAPSKDEVESLEFAWTVAAHTRSNAVVLARGTQAVGVGAGDQSRVGAAERAVARAGGRAEGAVAASEAFLPFRDGIDTLAAAGVTALVQPGGSRNDGEVVAAADDHDMAMLFTGRRHFRH